MAFDAQNNVNYGGGLVNQKYTPLENIVLSAPRADYEAMFNARTNILGQAGVFPKVLYFYADWPAIPPVLPNLLPPMVVISNNRATWMAQVLQNAVDHGAFNGYTDQGTFSHGPVPWYAPGRSGRHLYVVVHYLEYDYYQNLLGGFNQPGANPVLTVVGYKYETGTNAFDMVGFGASSHAALRLMVRLQYPKAWVVDDNVVNITGFPQTLAPIEAYMDNTMWGIGFTATTRIVPETDIYGMPSSDFNAKPFDFANMLAGRLQQAVLWNTDQIGGATINFSPLFVSSNEDGSFNNYLGATNRPRKLIKPLKIMKVTPTQDTDNRGASTGVQQRRDRLMRIFQLLEEGEMVSGVPIKDFVKDTILPKCQEKTLSPVRTQCVAIEQVLTEAIGLGWVPANVFMPYTGFNGPQVELRMTNQM